MTTECSSTGSDAPMCGWCVYLRGSEFTRMDADE